MPDRSMVPCIQAQSDVYRGQELQRNTTVTELFSGAVVGHPPDHSSVVIQSTFFFHQQGDLVGWAQGLALGG